MPLVGRNGQNGPLSRRRGPGEPEAEHVFWCRYWEVIRAKGVPAGREIWFERACHRFIRELRPKRLKEATAQDVTNFLGLLGRQPDSTGWKIRQADQALQSYRGKFTPKASTPLSQSAWLCFRPLRPSPARSDS